MAHFWRGSLLAAERLALPDDEVDAILARAYGVYGKPEDGWALWLEYVGVVRRRGLRDKCTLY